MNSLKAYGVYFFHGYFYLPYQLQDKRKGKNQEKSTEKLLQMPEHDRIKKKL
jgi:hypothetical protein